MEKIVLWKSEVFEALDNALENGYDMSRVSIDEAVEDLKNYDASLENVEAEVLKPFVEEWVQNRARSR